MAREETLSFSSRKTLFVILRILLTLFVIVFTGVWGFMALFTDASPRWGHFGWAAYLLGGHALAGFLVGILIPRRWNLAIAATWGALVFGVAGIIASGGSGAAASSNVPLTNQLLTTALALIAIPGVAALAAYQGSRITTKKRSSTALPPQPH